MKVHYKKDTKEIWGYYPNEYDDIPTPNIEISDEVWQKAINNGATHINPKTKELYTPQKELSLNELKELKKAEILNAFNRNLENLDSGLSIEPLGIVVDCGRIHAENISSMITLLSNTNQNEITFRLYDNTSRLTSLDELKIIQTQMITQGFKTYEKKWALEQSINEATSKEQIEAIKW